jgi:hypothetical protein
MCGQLSGPIAPQVRIERALRLTALTGAAQPDDSGASVKQLLALMTKKCSAGGSAAVYRVPNFEALQLSVEPSGVWHCVHVIV